MESDQATPSWYTMSNVDLLASLTAKVEETTPREAEEMAGLNFEGDYIPLQIVFSTTTNNHNHAGSKHLNGMASFVSRKVNSFLECLLALKVQDITNESAMVDTIQATYGLFREWDPHPLPLAFESKDEYVRKFTPLIILDTWAQWDRELYAQASSLPRLKFGCTQIRSKKNGECLCLQSRMSQRVYKQYRDSYNFEKFIVILAQGEECKVFGLIESINFSDSSMIEDEIPVIDGCSMERLEKGDDCTLVTLMLRLGNDGFLDQVRSSLAVEGNILAMIVQPFFYLRPSIRLIETLNTLQEHPQRYQFFEKFLTPSEDFCSIELDDRIEAQMEDGHLFNKQQKRAIQFTLDALRHPAERLIMIQGPPGTGKTHTLIGLIKNIFTNMGVFMDSIQLIVCAPSNGAVDEVARRLLDIKIEGKALKLVRVGRGSQVHPTVAHLHIDRLVEQCEASSSKADRVSRTIIEQSHIILATLGSSHFQALGFMRKYTDSCSRLRCVIVDEAAQCTEPELLMPLVYPVDKLILVGDPLQLPATIMSSLAIKLNYGRSMFERFYDYFGGKHDAQVDASKTVPLIMLTHQFRMQEEIVQLPSRLFYGGRLQTPPGTGMNARVQLKPYLVFDVTQTWEHGGGTSFANDLEAQFVLKLLIAIYESVVTPKIKIGVITFYRAQKNLLNHEIQMYQGGELVKAGVTIDTVDSYQGREMDIIVLSCVRTTQVGFVQSLKRMNVALTRAKSALYVCLNAQTFQTNRTWGELIENAKDRERLYTCKWRVSAESLKKTITK